MQIPLALLDSTAVEEIPIDLWRNAFDTIGWPSRLVTKRESFSHTDLTESLTHDTPSDELLQLLEALHDLGTASGKDAIDVAMKDRRVSGSELPANASARELALHLYLAQRTDAALNEVFARAQIQVQEGSGKRRYNEFMGKSASAVNHLEKKKVALAKQVADYCAENALGDHVHVDAIEDDGVFVFRIVRSDRIKKPLVVMPGSSGRTVLQYRPVHCDIIHYDSDAGLIRMAVKASAVVQFYREAFGELLFGDKRFFSGEPVCSLAVLQREGSRLLSHHKVLGISRVRMTECLWDRGGRELMTLRSDDCFETIEKLGLDLGQGMLIQAKLKLDIIGKSTRPVTVNIRVPSRIEISQTSKEVVVNQFLTEIGIRNSQREQMEVDLFSLLPAQHPFATWKALFKGETDRLIAAGALAKVRLDAIETPIHPGAGRVFEVHPLPNGDYYGVSRMSEIPSRTLSATDIDGWEFVPENFRVFLRTRLGIQNPSITYTGSGLLDLGILEIGGQRVRVFYALTNSLFERAPWARERAAGDQAVILLDPAATMTSGSGILEILMESSVPVLSVLVRQIVTALRLSVPANLIAPEGANLVVDTKVGKVWVNGVPIDRLMTDSQPYRFIEMLARANGAPVSSQDLNERLSPGRKDEDVATRHAKKDVNELIRAALAAAGQPSSEDYFPSVRPKMYRCALIAFVL